MCPRTSCPLSSWTLNIVFGRASTISPSISIFSSLGTSGDASDEAYVHRLRTLVARLFLVLHLGVLRQGLEALSVDAAVVDEQVPLSIIGSDEAEALLVVEPLHGSGRHVTCPFLRVPGPASPDAPAYADYAGPSPAQQARRYQDGQAKGDQRPVNFALPGPSVRNERTAP